MATITIEAHDVEVRDRYNTTGEMAEDNRKIGHHWFEKDTMRFFGTRIAPGVYGGHYFITSDFTGFEKRERAYTIRKCVNGSVETVGEFLAYPTLRHAKSALRTILSA